MSASLLFFYKRTDILICFVNICLAPGFMFRKDGFLPRDTVTLGLRRTSPNPNKCF